MTLCKDLQIVHLIETMYGTCFYLGVGRKGNFFVPRWRKTPWEDIFLISVKWASLETRIYDSWRHPLSSPRSCTKAAIWIYLLQTLRHTDAIGLVTYKTAKYVNISKYTVNYWLLVSANTEFLCDVFFNVCKHPSPCGVTMSGHHNIMMSHWH